MRSIAARSLLLACLAILVATSATAESQGDDCHAAFSYYLGAHP